MPGAPRQLTAEDLANLSNSSKHRGINSDAAKAQREKHLTATFTTRDIFGICRGACTELRHTRVPRRLPQSHARLRQRRARGGEEPVSLSFYGIRIGQLV